MYGVGVSNVSGVNSRVVSTRGHGVCLTRAEFVHTF